MILIFETNTYFSEFILFLFFLGSFYRYVKMKFGRMLKPLIINDDPISIDRRYAFEQNGR